jgi:hypothetical protein
VFGTLNEETEEDHSMKRNVREILLAIDIQGRENKNWKRKHREFDVSKQNRRRDERNCQSAEKAETRSGKA